MEKKKSILIKAIVFILNFLILLLMIFLYLSGMIIMEVLLALLFLQSLACGMMLFIYLLYKKFQQVGRQLGFRYIKGSWTHPKFEGHYKKNWFQVHYISKETGDQWGVPRTYIKLQFKEKREFDQKKLKKYNTLDYRGNRIVSLSHVERNYKNYLLLKRQTFTFNVKKIHQLMDLLIRIAEEAKSP